MRLNMISFVFCFWKLASMELIIKKKFHLNIVSMDRDNHLIIIPINVIFNKKKMFFFLNR